MMIESDRVIAVGEVTVVAEVKTIGTTSLFGNYDNI